MDILCSTSDASMIWTNSSKEMRVSCNAIMIMVIATRIFNNSKVCDKLKSLKGDGGFLLPDHQPSYPRAVIEFKMIIITIRIVAGIMIILSPSQPL